MNKIYSFFMLFLLLSASTLALVYIPTGDYDYKNRYSIWNVSNLTVQRVCIAGDCRTAWPTGGGSGGISSISSLDVYTIVVNGTSTTIQANLSAWDIYIGNRVDANGNWSADKPSYLTATQSNNKFLQNMTCASGYTLQNATTSGAQCIPVTVDTDTWNTTAQMQAATNNTLTAKAVACGNITGASSNLCTIVDTNDGTGGWINTSTTIINTPPTSVTVNGSLINRYESANQFSGGLSIQKVGNSSSSSGSVKDGAEIGYHSFYAWNGSTYNRASYVLVKAKGDQNSTNAGSTYSITTTPLNTLTPVRRIFINERGDVGIGTSSPTFALDVPNNISKLGNIFFGNMNHITADEGAYIYQNVSGNHRYFYLGVRNDNTLQSGIEMMENNSADTGEYLLFRVGNGAIRQYIDKDGNVGIGTTDPTQKLDVNGSVNVSTEIYVGTARVCRSDGTNCPASAAESDPVWNGNASRVTNLETANSTTNGRIDSLNNTKADKGTVLNTTTVLRNTTGGNVNITGTYDALVLYANCVAITGSTELCDGSDAGTGGGMTAWTLSNGSTTESITDTEQVNITAGRNITITQVGSQLVINAIDTDTDTDTNGYTIECSISGTTSKTAQCSRNGMANFSYSWTDLDTDTFNTTAQMIAATNNTLNALRVACGNITGAASNLCTIVDTDTDTNNYTVSIDVTGTTTKIVNLVRSGAPNINASFTDIDTDTSNYTIECSISGTTSKTAQCSRNGMVNFSYSWTDIDTTYTNGSGIGLVGTQFNHSDTSSQASSDNSGRTYIQDITLDGFGHITGLVTATETVVDTNNYTTSIDITGTTTKIVNLVRNGAPNINASFTDIDTDTWNTTDQMRAATNNTLTALAVACGNVTGASSNLCTLVDTDTDTQGNLTVGNATNTYVVTTGKSLRFIAGRNVSSVDIANDTSGNLNITINAIDTTGGAGGGFSADQAVNRSSNVTFGGVNITSQGFDAGLVLNSSGYCWRLIMEGTELKIKDCDGSVVGTFNKDSDSLIATNFRCDASYNGATACTVRAASGQLVDVLQIGNSSHVFVRVEANGTINASKGIRINATNCDVLNTSADGTIQCDTDASGATESDPVWNGNSSLVLYKTSGMNNGSTSRFNITGVWNALVATIAANSITGTDIDESTLGAVPTATALAADPANCAVGSSAGGVTAGGVAESCQDTLNTSDSAGGEASGTFGALVLSNDALDDQYIELGDAFNNASGDINVTGTYGALVLKANCVAITGSADLCDGSDGGGAGGNPFNQSLNTTDNVNFANVNVSKNITVGSYINLAAGGGIIGAGGIPNGTAGCAAGTVLTNVTMSSDGVWTQTCVVAVTQWTNRTNSDQHVLGTTLANITGLEWNAAANTNYTFDCVIFYRSNLTTNGISFALEDWGSTVRQFRMSAEINSVSATTQNSLTANVTATKITSTAVTAANTVYSANVKGNIVMNGNAVVITPQFSAEIAGSNSTIVRDSYCRVTVG